MEANSVHAIVTDPPYGLSFMGKKWDYDVPSVDVWRECLRVLKPGGHMLVACGTRTQHRMAVNIEDAGFEIRDVITWLYGSGFPKSLDVSKALDKAAGAEREIVGHQDYTAPDIRGNSYDQAHVAERERLGVTITAPTTDLAKQWQGWGTSLKPACEFWSLCRKPLEGTVAANVTKWGVGGINVDGTRIEASDHPGVHHAGSSASGSLNWNTGEKKESSREYYKPTGRFPANLILDEEAAAALDEQSGTLKSGAGQKNTRNSRGNTYGAPGAANSDEFSSDSGGASRFFYVAKASKSERNAGCEHMEAKACGMMEDDNYPIKTGSGNLRDTKRQNFHPTVKPVKLMRYLCRLITPPGGVVLDPFAGSGSTLVAAKIEGFKFLGIEREAEYVAIIRARVDNAQEA